MDFSTQNNFWFVRSVPKKTNWNTILQRGYFQLRGLKNPQSAKSISQMQIGDLAIYYETEPVKSIIGILEVVSCPFPDPTISGEKFYSIDFKIYKSLENPIPLSQYKYWTLLENHSIVTQPRVFAFPISKDLFLNIISYSNASAIINDSVWIQDIHSSTNSMTLPMMKSK